MLRRREGILTRADKWLLCWELHIAVVEVEQFVANFLVPDPHSNLELGLNSLQITHVLLCDFPDVLWHQTNSTRDRMIVFLGHQVVFNLGRGDFGGLHHESFRGWQSLNSSDLVACDKIGLLLLR